MQYVDGFSTYSAEAIKSRLLSARLGADDEEDAPLTKKGLKARLAAKKEAEEKKKTLGIPSQNMVLASTHHRWMGHLARKEKDSYARRILEWRDQRWWKTSLAIRSSSSLETPST